MADSRRALFTAAAAGNVAPILLKWWSHAEEGITLPGTTWIGTIGWAVATLMMAAFAGWVATDVWKERTTRRAFVVGLALPYILWGFLADASSVARLPRARGDEPASSLQDLVTLRIDVLDFTTKTMIPDATTTVGRAGTDDVLATSKIGTYALPRGDYRVVISAPGYESAKGDVKLVDSLIIVMHLYKAPWWRQFLGGAATVFFPPKWTPATGTQSNAPR